MAMQSRRSNALANAGNSGGRPPLAVPAASANRLSRVTQRGGLGGVATSPAGPGRTTSSSSSPLSRGAGGRSASSGRGAAFSGRASGRAAGKGGGRGRRQRPAQSFASVLDGSSDGGSPTGSATAALSQLDAPGDDSESRRENNSAQSDDQRVEASDDDGRWSLQDIPSVTGDLPNGEASEDVEGGSSSSSSSSSPSPSPANRGRGLRDAWGAEDGDDAANLQDDIPCDPGIAANAREAHATFVGRAGNADVVQASAVASIGAAEVASSNVATPPQQSGEDIADVLDANLGTAVVLENPDVNDNFSFSVDVAGTTAASYDKTCVAADTVHRSVSASSSLTVPAEVARRATPTGSIEGPLTLASAPSTLLTQKFALRDAGGADHALHSEVASSCVSGSPCASEANVLQTALTSGWVGARSDQERRLEAHCKASAQRGTRWLQSVDEGNEALRSAEAASIDRILALEERNRTRLETQYASQLHQRDVTEIRKQQGWIDGDALEARADEAWTQRRLEQQYRLEDTLGRLRRRQASSEEEGRQRWLATSLQNIGASAFSSARLGATF